MTPGRAILRNSVWSALDLGVSFVASLVTSVLVARAMGPVKLGYYSYVLWLVQMTFFLASLGVPAATRRYLAEHLGEGDNQAAGGIIRFSLWAQAGSALAVIGLGLVASVTLLTPEHRAYTQLAVLSLMPTLLLAVVSAVNWAREDFAANAIPSMVASVLHAIGVLVALALGLDLVGVTAALLLSRLADCGLRFWLLFRAWPALPTLLARAAPLPPSLRDRIVRFALQSTMLLLLDLVVWNRSEVLFLRHLCDIRAVAYFSLAFGLVGALRQSTEPFVWAASPALLRRQSRAPGREGDLTAAFLKYLALLAVPLALGLAALAAPLVGVLYGSAFDAAIPVVVLGALLSLPATLGAPAQYHIAAADAQSFTVKWLAICATLTLFLDYWLVTRWCALGGAVANGLGQIIASLGVWAFVVRRYDVQVPFRALGRIAFAGVVLGGGLFALSAGVTPLIGLLAGPPLGLLVYALVLRHLGVLDAVDRVRLLEISALVPSTLRAPCQAAITWLTRLPPS